MKLYFQNSNGKEILIAEPITMEDVDWEIEKFLATKNFKSHYTRVWERNGRLKFDFGSHTDFFYLEV